jgi:hypothetical protein
LQSAAASEDIDSIRMDRIDRWVKPHDDGSPKHHYIKEP